MRSHERLNRRSANVSGESRQVTESGVTEPGLQADSPVLALGRAKQLRRWAESGLYGAVVHAERRTQSPIETPISVTSPRWLSRSGYRFRNTLSQSIQASDWSPVLAVHISSRSDYLYLPPQTIACVTLDK